MAEVGIEIATEQPKILTADAVKASDVVIIASTGIHAVIRKCDLWIRKVSWRLSQ
jgi:protein-tyrosine-phosphatase